MDRRSREPELHLGNRVPLNSEHWLEKTTPYRKPGNLQPVRFDCPATKRIKIPSSIGKDFTEMHQKTIKS